MSRQRVVVAMSGGVDSSVAAALLVEQGYDVVGLMLRLWSEADNGHGPANRCCALDAQYDAERVAERLDIPFYLVNVARAFKRHVVHFFLEGYAAGRTPNPCVECNRHIRFDLLLRRAMALEADFLATGHYARVKRRNGRYELWRGVDPHKDQSYVLHVLGQSHLAHVLFPLGDYDKTQVREMARRFGLGVADREESQDLCFVGDGNYRRFVSEHRPESVRPGPIRDSAGQILGEHSGLGHYTVGQRKGIGVSGPERLYVLALDVAENTLLVGTAEELGRDMCFVHGMNWVQGEPPGDHFEASAKIRYKAHEVPVTVTMLDNDSAQVMFEHPKRDITPGQAVVFYQDQNVMGGGTISWSRQSDIKREQGRS